MTRPDPDSNPDRRDPRGGGNPAKGVTTYRTGPYRYKLADPATEGAWIDNVPAHLLYDLRDTQ